VISLAQDVRDQLNHHINLNDGEWVLTLGQFDIGNIKTKLENIFDADFKALAERLNGRGLSHSYQKMLKNIDYLMQQAYLHPNDERKTLKSQILCVLARTIICKVTAMQLLENLSGSISEVIEASKLSLIGSSITTNCLSDIFRIGNLMSRSKGYEREISSILEDYCHFLDLIHMLLGGKAEVYGTRIRADIYPFQIVYAIRELMVSRTESCEAAAFLIRSLLKVWIRRSIFRNDHNTNIQYIPKRSLDIPVIFKCCKRNGLEFTYSYEILNLVWENLNLVVHF
jgi:hypothetical protein